MSDLKGVIASISFYSDGGTTFSISVAGTPGTSVVFSSTNQSVIPPPATSSIPANGVLIVSTTAAQVSANTNVTLSAGSSTSADDGEVRVPQQLSMGIYVRATI